MNIRTYSELITIPTFEERYQYLNLLGKVGEATFGSQRYLNQILYNTDEWKSLRRDIIIRDKGCDLGMYDREIKSRIVVHHMNPITIDDILNRNPKIFDPENLITSAHMTHEAIHYGNEDLLDKPIVVRREYDTCPWRQ